MKKILALIMVVAMMATFASVVSAESGTLPTEGLVANYTFDNGAEEGLTAEGENITYKDGKALFGGESVLVSNLDVKGYEEITIAATFEMTGPVNGTNWLYSIDSNETASWGSQHFMAFNINNEFVSYACPSINTWCNGCSVNWANDKIPADVKAGGVPVNVVITFGYEENGVDGLELNAEGTNVNTGYFHSLYVNGELIGHWYMHSGETPVTLDMIIGETPKLVLGKANIGSGEFTSILAIDNFAVYNRALTKDEAVAASTTSTTPPTDETQAPTDETEAPDDETQAPTTDKPEKPDDGKEPAPPTGFATIALAIAAIGSGAYVVCKKRH